MIATRLPSIRFFLLRGLARESGHWGAFLPLLRQGADTESCVPMDLPGTGANRRKRATSKLAPTLSFLQECYQDRLDYDQKKCLIGISLGGMIAWQWALGHPAEFSHLVVINVSFADSGHVFQRLRPFGFYQISRIAACGPDLKAREHLILDMVSNLSPSQRASFEESWTQLAANRPIALLTVLKQLLLARSCRFKPSWFGERSSVKPPPKILILSSERDRMVDPSCSSRLAQSLNLPHIRHQSAGHDLALDDPEWLASVIFDWLGDREEIPSRRETELGSVPTVKNF